MIQIRDRAYHKNTDTYSMSEIGIPGIVLMERAAYALVQEIVKRIQKADRILAVCGSGNNGGDGIAAARILRLMGYSCDILLFRGKHGLTDETEQQLGIAKKIGIRIFEMFSEEEAEFEDSGYRLEAYEVIIDALFGIGLTRSISGAYQELIERINASDAFIIAADVPSGVNADTGEICGVAVSANQTVSFGYGKPGLYLYPGAACAGNVIVSDIGFVSPCEPEYDIFAYESLAELPIGKRRPESHKGTYGKILVVAGFESMSGACCMAAEAAYRSGAGLVRVFTSTDSMRALQARVPELMVSSYEQDAWEEVLTQQIAWADVIAIGPGLGKSKLAKSALELVLSAQQKALVLDADAINLLEGDLRRVPAGAVLTPHPAELSRLLQIPVDEIKKDRIGIVNKQIKRDDIVLVCKDARTIISQGKRFCINLNGNSGMATGGSGDVLTGIIAAFLASGTDAYDAACAAVRVHAEAGDRAAKELSQHAMLATDIIKKLPEIFREIEENTELIEV